jgi:hypothetical protein
MVSKAMIIMIALTGIIWSQTSMSSLPSLDDMREEQADAWWSVHGICMAKMDNPLKEEIRHCTYFADQMLKNSAQAHIPLIQYAQTHKKDRIAREE